MRPGCLWGLLQSLGADGPKVGETGHGFSGAWLCGEQSPVALKGPPVLVSSAPEQKEGAIGREGETRSSQSLKPF